MSNDPIYKALWVVYSWSHLCCRMCVHMCIEHKILPSARALKTLLEWEEENVCIEVVGLGHIKYYCKKI